MAICSKANRRLSHDIEVDGINSRLYLHARDCRKSFSTEGLGLLGALDIGDSIDLHIAVMRVIFGQSNTLWYVSTMVDLL